MARFRVLLGHIVLCVAVISALLSGCDARTKAEIQFVEDIDDITADIQVMYDEVDADFLYLPTHLTKVMVNCYNNKHERISYDVSRVY